MDDDLDLPPASTDPNVQNFLDTIWREAVRANRETIENIRKIYPELVQHLPETAERHLEEALRGAEKVSRGLHLAGRHVLGQGDYDDFIEAQTKRQIQS